MKREKMLYYIIMDCLHFTYDQVKDLIDKYDIEITGDRVVTIQELSDTNWRNRLSGSPAKMNKPNGVGPVIRNIRKVKSGEIQLKPGYIYRVSTVNDHIEDRYIYDFYIGRFHRLDAKGLVFNACIQLYKEGNQIVKKDLCNQYDYIEEKYHKKNYVIPFHSNITEIQKLGNPIVSPNKLLHGQMSNRQTLLFNRQNQSLEDITRNSILQNPELMKEIQGTLYYPMMQNYIEGEIEVNRQNRSTTRRRSRISRGGTRKRRRRNYNVQK